MSQNEWLAVAGLAVTVLGGILASYMAIKVELAKLGVTVINFNGHIERIDREIGIIRDVVDRRAHGTRH